MVVIVSSFACPSVYTTNIIPELNCQFNSGVTIGGEKEYVTIRNARYFLIFRDLVVFSSRRRSGETNTIGGNRCGAGRRGGQKASGKKIT
jgi:hypothetical protein